MFPDYLDGARVLEYTKPGNFGFITDYNDAGTGFEREICFLAICAYTGDPACYLFYCDAEYHVIADNCGNSVHDLKHHYPRDIWQEKHPPYLCTAAYRKVRGGSCYFEFQRGRHQGNHWLDGSVYLDDDLFDQLRLGDIFSAGLPYFDHYGTTEVTLAQYQELKALAADRGGEVAALFEELNHWAEDCFFTENVFTICGI